MQTLLALTLIAAAPPVYHADAALRAVQFVDGREGWACGDDGVVWHTIDAGGSWERQPTGTRASLRALHFVTPYCGWAVGREERPSKTSVGVVLRTEDGGITWRRVAESALPGLHAVRFFDGKAGLAAGDGSESAPAGLFATNDGGQSWRALPGPRTTGWRAADFSDSRTGALAGTDLVALRDSRPARADFDELKGRAVNALRLDGAHALAVGQGGLIMVSDSTAGARWAFAAAPKELGTALDLNAIAQSGAHRWAVGRPGTVVLHSADRGRTWAAQPTGQPLPLYGLHFADDKTGWAVGDFGTILGTTDGGQTWKVQRQGGQRAALLCVQGANAVPLDAAAALGLDDGYLMACVRLSNPADLTEAHRLAAAWRSAGGAATETLWPFPTPDHAAGLPPERLLTAWKESLQADAADAVLRQLVLAIRQWRPDVVLGGGAGSLEALTAEALPEAVRRAADPKEFPEQLQHLGLSVWVVKKLYLADDAGSVKLDFSAARPRLGDAPRDFAAGPAALLSDDVLPNKRTYRLASTALDGAAKHVHLLQGIDLAPGGTARRELSVVVDVDAAALAKQIQKKRNAIAVAGSAATNFGGPERALAQIGTWVKDLPSDTAAAAIYAVGTQYARAGQWHLARETFLLLADRFPGDPKSAEAYRWLLRYHGSSEARRRHELGHFLLTTTTEVRPLRVSDKAPGDRAELVQNSQLLPLSNLVQARRWYEAGLEIEPRLAAFGTLYANDPGVQFPLAAARRHLAQFEPVTKFYKQFLAATAPPPGTNVPPGQSGYRDAAAMELWLDNRGGPSPKPLGECRLLTQRPNLDGDLNDDCWPDVQTLPLKAATGEVGPEYRTQAKLAFDNEFLYLSVDCLTPEPAVPPAEKRTRDADLSGQDRIELMLDLDRDYQTYFRFVVDRRGCYAEDCWGDRNWNPRWFIAVKPSATGWSAELAIPIIELTAEPLTLGRLWAANVTRVVPGRGVLAWSLPADATPKPEGMGVVLFSERPKPVLRGAMPEEKKRK